MELERYENTHKRVKMLINKAIELNNLNSNLFFNDRKLGDNQKEITESIYLLRDYEAIENVNDQCARFTDSFKRKLFENDNSWDKVVRNIDGNRLYEFHNKREKERLEKEVAKSTISANELNLRNESYNKRATAINIFIGILNLLLLVWQLYKAG